MSRSPIFSYPSTPPATLPSTALRYQTHQKGFDGEFFTKSTIGGGVADIRYLMVYSASFINCVFVGVFQYQINFQYQISKSNRSSKGGMVRDGIPEASVVSLGEGA